MYRARDTRLDRSVAIKVLSSSQTHREELRQRFEREARLISTLNHPHICTLYDVGHQESIDYLVMEYVEGETLERRLERGPLSAEQAVQAAVQIADALDAAHRLGIVHRDLKPSNVILTKSGVKLLDFGLAKLMQTEGAHSPLSALATAATMTAEGTILGTLQYMSPEQLEGKEADWRADIWGLGCILYESVTGRKAFEGKSQASLISSIMSSQPAPVSNVQPVVPASVDHVIQMCLAKNPDDRWQSARDVVAELKWVSSSAAVSGAAIQTQASRRERWIV